MDQAYNDLLYFEDEHVLVESPSTTSSHAATSLLLPDLLSTSCQGLPLSPALTPDSTVTAPAAASGVRTLHSGIPPPTPLSVVPVGLPTPSTSPSPVFANKPVGPECHDDSLAAALLITPEQSLSKEDKEVIVPDVPLDPFLVPRTYQIKLFRKALEENIIAVMDTGSGKTLVAVMLIKEMMQREEVALRDPSKRKLCFFIVNNVPLVSQQASVIRANSACRVMEMCGQKQTKKFSEEVWKLIHEEADVVVLTAQILLDLFRHGSLRMHRVLLLIFDECHHARKDHPYCGILKEFYHDALEQDRPKVFGMTASPSLDVGSKLYHSANELEKLMDSRIYTVDQDQLQAFIERPNEYIVQYRSPPKYDTTQLTLDLREQCSMSVKLESSFASVDYNLAYLGPWCADRLWHIFVEHLGDITNRGLASLSDDVKVALNVVKSRPLVPPLVDPAYLSPKVLKLVQLLRVAAKGLTEDFCGIVFVERRDTAIAMCLLLQELAEFHECFRVQVLAGHSEDSDPRVLRMTFREQNEIIKNFKNKEYNLLIATSVAEEGLDIQPCNFVVRFDPATTIISYIQSRGRARKKNSRYIIMQELENRSEEATFEKIKYSEKNMKEWCQSLDEERLMENPMDVDADNAQDKLTPTQIYRIPSTGALLTLDSSIPLVHYYCSTLAGDEFCSMKADFNVMSNGSSGFVCDLTLPPTAPIRLVQSDRTSTKNMAKKSAAFKACEKLHMLGALNDYLLPTMKELVKEEERDEIQIDNKDKNKSYPVSSPAFWKSKPEKPGETQSLFGCVIEFEEGDLDNLGGKDRYRTMCLLTRKPLPCAIAPFHLFVDGSARSVTMRSSPSPVLVEKGRMELLQRFTLTLFQRMCRKSFDCPLEDMPYFVAPLVKDFSTGQALSTSISWEDVTLGQNTNPLPYLVDGKEDSVLNSILTFRHDHGRDFFVKKALREFRVHDVMPSRLFDRELASWEEAIAKGKIMAPESSAGQPGGVSDEAKNRTFAQYFKWKYNISCHENETILLVERVRKMRNNLQPALRDEERADEGGVTIAPLSICMLCSVKADVLRMSQMIPSILYSLDSTLLAQEVREKIGLGNTRLDYLQVALTTSSANRDFQYERLELLGDSFLKFSSTIRLYIVNPAKDEGQLHANRIRIISNKALLGHATDLELYRYVSSTPFHRKSWRPTRFIVEGKPWKDVQHHNISNKMLADIIEASLGAAYLSGGVKAGFEAAKALRIPCDEFKDWDDFQNVYSQAKAVKEELEDRSRVKLDAGHFAGIREVQKMIGYEFKDPLLFVEAMTHASHIRTDPVCYQRLEFLGDAVLDFQVIQYYYEKYSDAPPGAITLIKDASVNNSILGAISIEWGLHKYLNHYSPTLMSAISRTIATVDEIREQSPTNSLDGEYWMGLNMPKVLGDLVESTLGAVFVDSGFDFDVVTHLFMRMIRPFLDAHINFDGIVIHPSKVLLEKLQAKGCNTFCFVNDNEGQGSKQTNLLRKFGLGIRTSSSLQKQTDENEAPLKCHFKIHGKIMATATGDHIEDLRKEVAIATLAKFNDDPEMLTTLCICPKRKGARHVSMLDRYRQ